VRSAAISPDGRRALVGLSADPAHDRPLVLWDLETFQVIRTFEGPTTAVDEVVISPDGRFALTGAENERFVSLWDLETGEELQRLEGHEAPVIGVALSPDGRTALSTDEDGLVIWWNLDTGEPLQRLRGHTGVAWDVEFVDDTLAVSSSKDGTLRLWDLTTAWQLDHWGGADFQHGAAVTALAISPDGRLALSGAGGGMLAVADDYSLIQWDYQTGEPLRRLEGHQHTVSDVVFSPDSRQALSGSYDGTLILWDLDTGEPIYHLEGHTQLVTGVDISSDGSHALSSAYDGTIIYWDLSTGNVVRRLTGHQFYDVEGVVFLPGDDQALSHGTDASLILWDLATGQRLRRMTGTTGRVGGHLGDTWIVGMAPSPDGRTALSVGWDDQLIVWDLASGESIQRLEGHASNVRDVALSPDGRRALSSGWDNYLVLWDMATGTPLRRLPVSDNPGEYLRGNRVAIHPDGATALSGEPDGTLLKWQLAEPSPAELIAWIGDNRHLRELTCLERETYQIAPFCDEDGISTGTTADLLAAAAAAASSEAVASAEAEPPLAPASAPLPTPTPRPTRVARLGDNRGELARHDFEVWTYDGQAGEVLTLHMQADNPLTEMIPYEERFAAGVTDPVLMVTGPDGSLLAIADDAPTREDWPSGDTLIEAVYLPVDGQYRIEAQSLLDEAAGGYTLTIESRQVDIDPAVLQSYAGRYQAPWGDIRTVYLEDGRLRILEGPYKHVLDPISETDFMAHAFGYRAVFRLGEDGHVSGFDIIDRFGRGEHVRLEE
jgi:WD40 repeat protein